MTQIHEASFLLDMPILLPALGYAAGRLTRLGETEFSQRRLGRALYGALLVGFWLIAGGLYFDRFSFEFFLGPMGRGNHFMWNSAMELLGLGPWLVLNEPSYVHPWSAPNLIAVGFLLFVYPALLWLGYSLGRRQGKI